MLGAWLGARLALGYDKQAHIFGQRMSSNRGLRAGFVDFNDKRNLQAVRRIIDFTEPFDQLRDDFRFLVQRDKDCILSEELRQKPSRLA